MVMDFKVTVCGDVIIYEKDECWNFVFITDDQHTVKHNINGIEEDLRLENRDRELTIDVRNGTATKRNPGPHFKKIFNMAHQKLHGKTGNKANLEVRRLSPPDREIVHLKVPVGIVDGAEWKDSNGKPMWYSDYRFARFPNGKETEIGHKTARLVTLFFSVTPSVGTHAQVALVEKGNPLELKVWHSADGSVDITLNNDCDCEGAREDFLHYYDWVRDKGESRKFFTARKPADFKRRAEVKNIEGNCDPVVIDPPPTGPDPEFP